MNEKTPNPYVGPRTFLENERDRFFGREREARDLLALAVSEQLILFYAQSGAGKSSLVNTCLIPDLRKKDFRVFPGRVIGDLPPNLEVENIYAFNLLRSLIPGNVNIDRLAHMTLSDYFQGIAEEKAYLNEAGEPYPHALIIDQFEELFSTHQDAWKHREGFFQQIADSMAADRYLWVILVMREDFIAALDPYAHLLPGRLRMRYLMQRLEHDAALAAIKNPVRKLRPYKEGVAETLVDNLAQIKVKLPDGELDERPGQYVEPVQLQVVCFSLWENLDPGPQITMEDLNKVGDVNRALETFYDGRVQAVANEKKVEERQVREWFDQEMITSSGTRNMVLRNPRGGQLDDEVIQSLQGDLIRAETRGGQTWYELSHDRLIEPIKTSNTKWFSANLSIFQQQAALWAAQGRPEGMLLRGKELEQAEIDQKRANAEFKTVPRDEVDFLTACLKARDRELREKRDNLRLRILAVGMAIFLVVVFGLAWTANTLRQQAEEAVNTANIALEEKGKALGEKEVALSVAEDANRKYGEEKGLREAEVLAGQALIALPNPDTVQLGRLLSVEAYEKNKASGPGEIIPNVYQALFDSVKGNNVPIDDKVFSIAAFSPGEEMKWLIIDNGLWSLVDRKMTPLDFKSSRVIQAEFQSDDRLTLVTLNSRYYSDEPYTAYTVNLNSQNTTPITLFYPEFDIDNIYLNANGRQIFASGWYYNESDVNSAVLVWDATRSSSAPTLYEIGEEEVVEGVAATSDGTQFILSTQSNIYMWRSDEADLYKGTRILVPDFTLFEPTFANGVFSGKSGKGLQLSPDGTWLARLTDTGIYIHNTSNIKTSRFYIPVTNVYGLLFSPLNDSLIYVTSNYQNCTRSQSCLPSASVYHFPLEDAQPKQQEIYKSTVADITALEISGKGKLVIGDENGYMRFWNLSMDLQTQLPQTISAHTGRISSILIGSDNQTVISTSNEDGTRLWKLTESTTDAVVINRISNDVSTVMRNNIQNTLAIGGINTEDNVGTVHVYSNFQAPDQSQPQDDSYTSGTGSLLSTIAISQNWIAAARTDRIYNRQPAYYLEFWNRSPEAANFQSVSFKSDSEISSLAFFPDGKYLAIALSSGELWMDYTAELDALRNSISTMSDDSSVEADQTSLKLPYQEPLPNDLGKIKDLLFTNDGRYLIGAGTTGVRIWDMQKPKDGAYTPFEATSPIHISPDHRQLATASTNNSFQIIDLQSLSSIDIPLSDHTSIINFAFSPDGKLLAVANKSGQVSVFELRSDEPATLLYTLRGAGGDITWIEYSPGPTGQQWLAAGGWEKVYLWKLAQPNVKPIELQGYNGYVTYVDFTDDGKWIITVAEDQTIRFWSLNPEKLRLAACKYAERNFTISEWERYRPGVAYNKENVETCKEFDYELEAQTSITTDTIPVPVQTLPFIQPPTPTPQPAETFIEYTVQSGDNLDLIAIKFQINRSILMEDNGISNPNLIRSGQVLKIRVTNTPAPP